MNVTVRMTYSCLIFSLSAVSFNFIFSSAHIRVRQGISQSK